MRSEDGAAPGPSRGRTSRPPVCRHGFQGVFAGGVAGPLSLFTGRITNGVEERVGEDGSLRAASKSARLVVSPAFGDQDDDAAAIVAAVLEARDPRSTAS